MNTRILGSMLLVSIVAILLNIRSASATPDPELTDRDKTLLREQGIEVAPKGPLHEAFARPFDLSPKATPAVPKEPPPPIPEIPPEQRPEGKNVSWIPGYWAWDEDKKGFLWVSGMYRDVPQGRKYVPGYWTQSQDGWQWVPGFFAPERQAEMQYVPQPPATLENGPSVPAPDANSFYSPGTWYYDSGQFVWRPGYWSPYQEGRIWVPSYFTWTPAGWVFVPGYWDYALADRGLMFAPVYFNNPYWNQAGWFYQPSICMPFGGLLDGLYCRNGYPWFYYGPYFSPFYAGLGFNPWYFGPFWGNPYFGYYRWHNRGNPGWWNGIRGAYAGGRVAPVNFARVNNITPAALGGTRLVTQTPAQIAAQRTAVTQVRQLAVNRAQLEGARAGASGVSTLRLGSAGVGNAATPAGLSNRGTTNTIRSAVNSNPVRTQTFNSGLQGSFAGKQALTGHAPAATNSVQANRFSNFSSQAYQPKTGITGTQRYTAQNYNPPRTNSYGGASNLYRSSNIGGYRPSTNYGSTYRPYSGSTFRPSTPAFRGGSGGFYGGRSGGYSGGRSGGGGGGGRGGGGHR